MSDTPNKYQYERQDNHEEVPGKRQHTQEGASNASGGSDRDGEGSWSGESGESAKSHGLSPGRIIVPYTGLNSGIPGDSQPYPGTRARFFLALASVTVMAMTLLAIWGLLSRGGFATRDRPGGVGEVDGVDTVRDTARPCTRLPYFCCCCWFTHALIISSYSDRLLSLPATFQKSLGATPPTRF